MADENKCADGGPHAWHETPGHARYTAQCIKCGMRISGKK